MITSAKAPINRNLFYENVEAIEGPQCHPGGVKGYGNPEGKVVFVGISPAREEMKLERPLVGPSGLLLNAMLESIGQDRSQFYCTNLICWWKDDPSPEEALRCAPRLQRELALLRPKLIIPLGGIVTEIFTGRKVGTTRGSVTWYPTYNAYVMPTYHPAGILRNQNGRDKRANSNYAFDLWRDLRKIKDVLTWPENDSLQKYKVQVVGSRQEAQKILDNLPTDGTPVTIDVETGSPSAAEIDIFVDPLLCVGIGTMDESWVIPREHCDDLDWPEKVRWIFHNGLFDAQVMYRHLGVWLYIHEDTMLMSHSLDERTGYHGLKELSREFNGAGFWEEELIEGKAKPKDYSKIPKPILYKYNGADAINTARLEPRFEAAQVVDNVRGPYARLVIPAVNAFKQIQYRGVHVDPEMMAGLIVGWGRELAKREEVLQAMAEENGWDSELNLNSPKQLGKFLYQNLSLPLPPSQKPSTDEDTLKVLQGMHPFIDVLMSHRHLSHMYSIYVTGMCNQIKYDGNVHAVVKLHGTVTGRLAYTKPPMQTIPRPFEEADYDMPYHILRQLFVPSNPDSVVIEADYGKAEIWMAHYYSKDPQLLSDLLSGDYHSTVAAFVMNKKFEEVTQPDRRAMKLVTFGVMYGREEKSLAAGIHRTEVEARAYIDGFYRRNAQYAAYSLATQQEAMQKGELVSLTGRKRRFMFLGTGTDHRALKQAINFPIQSSTSDCTLSSVIELHEKLREINAYIMLSVHDSIILECPKKNVTLALQMLHDVMTKPRFEGIDGLPVEMKVGASWGAAKGVHNCEDRGGCLEARRDGRTHQAEWDFSKLPAGVL